MNEIILAQIATAIIGTAIAAWQDWKTGLISDVIAYAMMAIAFIGLFFNPQPTSLELITIGGFAIIIAIGWIASQKQIIGWGDVLILAGIHALLPSLYTVTTIMAFALILVTLFKYGLKIERKEIRLMPYIFIGLLFYLFISLF